MRAAVMYGAGDVRVEDRPDPKIHQPADAVVRVLRAAICGSDLWPYASMPATDQGRPMGHEFLGVIEEAGSQVPGLKAGDLVISPFTWCDNTCEFCRKGLQTSCRHGGRYGFNGVDGGQGDAVRVPQAQGTLVRLPVAADSALLPSLLTLSDVLCTGHHGAVKAGVTAGRPSNSGSRRSPTTSRRGPTRASSRTSSMSSWPPSSRSPRCYSLPRTRTKALVVQFG
jgi:threonine dehydrogenase-like Zn-dependent dehydrogenase